MCLQNCRARSLKSSGTRKQRTCSLSACQAHLRLVLDSGASPFLHFPRFFLLLLEDALLLTVELAHKEEYLNMPHSGHPQTPREQLARLARPVGTCTLGLFKGSSH